MVPDRKGSLLRPHWFPTRMELILFSTGGWNCCSPGHCLCLSCSAQTLLSLQLSHHPPNSPDYHTSKYFSFSPISVSLASLSAARRGNDTLKYRRYTTLTSPFTLPTCTFTTLLMHRQLGTNKTSKGWKKLWFSPDWGKRSNVSNFGTCPAQIL